ncbi:protein AF-9 homolog [Drosophila rhopaloa]|uniref:Protein AF-9 homolog n=1 Tax=Drosophila rhopaloa TaxID=1041015 RepID=A0A6P4F7K7_DRORH|nr:protein AF-9 homolog [Drosophila rhopaloa]
MSYTNLLRHQNVVDDCQRVSCNRGPVPNLSGRCVISRDIVLGCRMELCDPDLPHMLEPTWSVYLRPGRDGGDLSRFVRRVTFKMSPRLPLRLHVADSAPFEISEVLGSDFPVEVQVQYVDPRMSATSYVFRPRVVREGHSGVSEEVCDKMIFVNPSPAMRQSLAPVHVPGVGIVGSVGGAPKAVRSSDSELKERDQEQVGDVAHSSQPPSPPKTLLKKQKRLSVGGPATISHQ